MELRTTNETRWITDSNGIAAFDDDGLMGHKVFFTITSHGYTYKKDGSGYTGVALDVKPGGSAKVEIHRQNIAERLYRITGEGIYRDSMMVGEPAPTRSPLFNGQVMGQDTVEVTPYRGKLYWFWGDTSRAGYPLGNFHTSGAVSLLPASGGLDPASGVDLNYFTDPSGFCKGMIPSNQPGPVWIGGLCTVTDALGNERLVCNYARMKGLGDVLERGLAQFNDKREIFEPISSLDLKNPRCPLGHPFHASVKGVDCIYSAISDSDPLPAVCVLSDLKHVMDPTAYEAYTCLVPGARYEGAMTKLDRTADGSIRYAWKPATEPVGWKQQQELIRDGKLKPEEGLIQLCDVETGKQLQPAGGSVFWNNYIRKWVMIFGQFGGSTSLLGEIWYSVADTPIGPWVYARKIVTHNNYTFYNPTQHPFFDQLGGKRIYFEGTYTKTFTDNKDPTPRYDYNQIMYALSLDDPRLSLPEPVYLTKGTGVSAHFRSGRTIQENVGNVDIQSIPFFAVPADQPHDGLIPLYEISTPNGLQLVTQVKESKSRIPMAFAGPLTADKSHTGVLTALYEYRRPDGSWLYSTNPALTQDGYVRSMEPICSVWRNPMSVLPLDWETKPGLKK